MRKRFGLIAVLGLLILALVAIPSVFAVDVPTYPDVTGTYTIGRYVSTKCLDGSRHPNIEFGELTITTQTQGTGAITDATLTWLGGDIDLDGLVGTGRRPYISLTGTDSDGSFVSIYGAVRTDREGVVTAISGRIQGYLTSAGGRVAYDDPDGGTVIIYTGANSYGGYGYSTLFTVGSDPGGIALRFNDPYTRMRARNLSTLSSGLSFYYKLQTSQTGGPQLELRFVAPTCTDPNGWGHVDISVHPLESTVGDGTWKQLVITSDSTPVTYFGNDPTDGTEFSKIGTGGPLSDTLTKIDAESAMTTGGDSAANWTLQRVAVEFWSSGVRTCYVDNVQIGRYTYTLEPAQFYGSFYARIQD